jgi:hypothetical protein
MDFVFVLKVVAVIFLFYVLSNALKKNNERKKNVSLYRGR